MTTDERVRVSPFIEWRLKIYSIQAEIKLSDRRATPREPPAAGRGKRWGEGG